MAQSEQEIKPVFKKVLETGTAVGTIGIIIGIVGNIGSILVPSIALAAGSFVGKQLAYRS